MITLSWWLQFLPQCDEFAAKALKDFGPDYKKSGWHLKMLGVSSEYQRKGVGSALVKYVEDMVSPRHNVLDKSLASLLKSMLGRDSR